MRAWVLAISMVAAGVCGGCPAEDGPVEPDTTVGADVDAEPEVGDTTDSEDAAEDVADAGPDASETNDTTDTGDATGGPTQAECEAKCAPFSGCEVLTQQECVSRCVASAGAGDCDYDCLDMADDCAQAEYCLDVAPPGHAFYEGPYGTSWFERAAPFTLPTLDGDFDFEAAWDGNDSYIFLMMADGYEYPEAIWASDAYQWLVNSPTNVHYFFMAYPKSDGTDDAEATVTAMKAHVDEAMALLNPFKRCVWERRVHYVPAQALSAPDWIGPMLQAKPVFHFAIDRFQRIRQVGLLGNVAQGVTGQLLPLGYEVRYFDFEREREDALVTDGVTEVVAYDNQTVGKESFEVDFPDAATMAGFDTLEIDLQSHCDGDDDQNCGEWDYLSHLFVCDVPTSDDNPDAATACDPGDADTDAETTTCPCDTPYGTQVDGTRTCLADGSGFGACECGCGNELARWITTYARQGRWITDSSPMLPMLKAGGTIRMRLVNGNPYVTRLAFRLRDAGKDARPTQIVPLFIRNRAYDASYNDAFEPVDVPIPAAAKRAEVVALITGHGFGVEVANCAEFCNHTHHFSVGGVEVVKEHPEAGTSFGCAAQVKDGTVPNQFGTWTLGRGGWCPGLDVKPFVGDVTAGVSPGETATISYESLYQGAPYVPEPYDNPNGGFGAQMRLSSWLVVYE